jgi:hypothetical protein
LKVTLNKDKPMPNPISLSITRVLWHLFFVSLSALFVSCGSQDGMQEVTLRDMDRLIVKHRYRGSTKNGWKAEAWLDGAAYPVWYPIDLWVRLTPMDPRVVTRPKAELRLALKPTGLAGAVRLVNVQPQFEECAKMAKHRETTFEDQQLQKVKRFPPKGPCWQCVVADPFQSDRRVQGTKPLEQGAYTLSVRIAVQGGPRFALEPMALTLDAAHPR